MGGGKHKFHKFRTDYEGKDWDKVPTKEMFDEIFRVSKNQIICGANYFSLPPTRGIICWDKMQTLPTFSAWELIWTSFDRPAKIYRLRNDDLKMHGTQKPIKLIGKLINIFSKDTDLIFDPFMGSWTTARACLDLKRNFIGAELSEEYCKIGENRIRQQILI